MEIHVHTYICMCVNMLAYVHTFYNWSEQQSIKQHEHLHTCIRIYKHIDSKILICTNAFISVCTYIYAQLKVMYTVYEHVSECTVVHTINSYAHYMYTSVYMYKYVYMFLFTCIHIHYISCAYICVQRYKQVHIHCHMHMLSTW